MKSMADASPGVIAYLEELARALTSKTLEEAQHQLSSYQATLPPPCWQAGEHILSEAFRLRDQASLRDALTGCWNRAHLEQALERALHETHRHAASGAFLLIDLDHFKSFNQQHGHLVGDHILQGVVNEWSRLTRQNDTLGRWGGDEFYLILTDTEHAGAEQVAHRLQHQALQLEPPVECSIGVALFAPDIQPDRARVRAVIQAADTALREAKKTRNHACYNFL